MVSGTPQLDETDPHYWLEWYALNSALAQQHRKKINFQRAAIFEDLKPDAHILSVGCGGALDLIHAPKGHENISVTLIDIDEEALLLAKKRVTWCKSTRTMHGDALRALRGMKTTYDRIILGGVFDYFDDRAISLSLRLADGLLPASGGKTIFTNVSTFATLRAWLESMVRWVLNLRSPEEIRALVKAAGIRSNRLSIERDATGLSLLCTIGD